MSWQQVIIETQNDLVEAISAELEAHGTLAITLKDAADDPIYEPDPESEPLWATVQVTALFNHSDDIAHKMMQIEQSLGLTHHLHYRLENVADQDWERSWMDDFKPLHFGHNLWVCPSWATPPDPEATNILLDPGLAFGTGTHATTALCLEWLSQCDFTDKNIVDYGCGSGILTLACLKLNAHHVWSVDHCEQALDATVKNVEHNEISAEKLSIVFPDQFHVTQTDLLIANILAGPIIELAPKFIALCPTHSEILLSGLLTSQVDEVLDTYNPHFKFDLPTVREEWVCLHGIRKNT